MDFVNGYFQLLVHPSNYSILNFKQCGRWLTYRRLSQGNSASPFIFSALMITILSELSTKSHVLNLLDDLWLITTIQRRDDVEQHAKDVDLQLDLLKRNNLREAQKKR